MVATRGFCATRHWGHILATGRHGARVPVMTALRGTAVPVPVTVAGATTSQFSASRFYVMERCDDTPYRKASELLALGHERTGAVAHHLVTVLATLHSVDPAEVGLSALGRPEGFLTRQVARWKTQLDGSRTRELPEADELPRRLAGAVGAVEAAGARPRIVHGDYRLDNVIVVREDAVAASARSSTGRWPRSATR